MRSVFLISRQWFVIAPLPNVAAKLTTVGPCQTRACCSRWIRPRPRIDGAVRVALDLEQFDRSVGLLPGVRNQSTADRAIGAHRVGFAGAGDPERLPNLGGMGRVESQDRESRRPRPRGADLEEVATSDLRHPIPPGSGTAGGPSSLPISLQPVNSS